MSQLRKKFTTEQVKSLFQRYINKELKIDQKTIKNKDIPLYKYNYSFVQQRLEDHYKQDASLWTVINRAKKNNLYLPKKPRKKAHDREVLTHYAGELIQHDTSFHLWVPDAKEK